MSARGRNKGRLPHPPLLKRLNSECHSGAVRALLAICTRTLPSHTSARRTAQQHQRPTLTSTGRSGP